MAAAKTSLLHTTLATRCQTAARATTLTSCPMEVPTLATPFAPPRFTSATYLSTGCPQLDASSQTCLAPADYSASESEIEGFRNSLQIVRIGVFPGCYVLHFNEAKSPLEPNICIQLTEEFELDDYVAIYTNTFKSCI